MSSHGGAGSMVGLHGEKKEVHGRNGYLKELIGHPTITRLDSQDCNHRNFTV